MPGSLTAIGSPSTPPGTALVDALARLDLDTARHVPWDGGVPFFLGDFVDAQGNPFPPCPRQTLKRVLAQAEINDGLARLGVWRSLLALRTSEGDLTPFLQMLDR